MTATACNLQGPAAEIFLFLFYFRPGSLLPRLGYLPWCGPVYHLSTSELTFPRLGESGCRIPFPSTATQHKKGFQTDRLRCAAEVRTCCREEPKAVIKPRVRSVGEKKEKEKSDAPPSEHPSFPNEP